MGGSERTIQGAKCLVLLPYYFTHALQQGLALAEHRPPPLGEALYVCLIWTDLWWVSFSREKKPTYVGLFNKIKFAAPRRTGRRGR